VGSYGAPYFRGVEAMGHNAGVGPDYSRVAAPAYFNMRKTSIYGGSNEIQRGIIAKMVLGL
jgi:alkylation response protein AidB-like acyl-CoA dehydrogenase